MATDVLSEGQNFQQARYIVNYDMPWNPMRLVQRNGCIDRLNSPFAGEEIYLFNLFPAGELDELLGLYERLLRRVAHANVSVGMEAPVFEDAAATKRNFADTAEQIRGIAGEDEAILDAAKAQLDAFSGEEFRMELRAALAAERLRELLAMPHGAGSGFRSELLPDDPPVAPRALHDLDHPRTACRAARHGSPFACDDSATPAEPPLMPKSCETVRRWRPSKRIRSGSGTCSA